MVEENIAADERIRKLASIQEITELRDHPDPQTNTLQVASILGWQIVISKNENLKKGQLVVFCEIDSMLPGDVDWLPNAVKKRVESQKRKDFFRVKTVQLRGELSQGLIIPELPELSNGNKWKIGDDITSILQIQKYNTPIGNKKFSSSNNLELFPTHLLSKTDEPRIQSYPNLLKAIKYKPYYSAVKLDGMSATFLIDPKTQEFLVCSRNHVRKCPTIQKTCPYFNVALSAKLEEKLRMNPGIALQGEICGPKIQNNLLGLRDLHFFVFNVIDLSSSTKKDFFEMCSMCQQMQLPTVPIEETSESFEYSTISQVLDRAKGTYVNSGKTREGLVFRSWDQSISFKVINNDFLI